MPQQYQKEEQDREREMMFAASDDICLECDGEGTVNGHLCKSCQGSGLK